MRYAIPLVFVLSACASIPDAPAPTTTADGTFVPAGATLNESGYISIGHVAPTPYPDSPPPEPRGIESFASRLSGASAEEQAKLWAEANGSEEFQNEVQRLQQILPTNEPGNFVQINLLRDETSMVDPQTLLGAEVWFKRDAAQTLAKYTSRADFFPRTGGLSEREVEALTRLWIDRVRDLKWPSSIGTNPSLGVVEITPGVTRERFEAVAAERGWTYGDEVDLTFAPPAPPPFADERLEGVVRTFARESSSPAIRMTALGMGRVILDDGCFRMAPRNGGGKGPLVMFAYDAQLGVDEEGYVVVTGTEGGERRTYRIGEEGAWGGPNGYDEGSDQVRELRERCGPGEIANLAMPHSLRIFSLPHSDTLADYAKRRRMDYSQAWDAVIACYERQERAGRSVRDAGERCVR